jgi:NhaP-type Na+/H+ or K+/H+ antiporter
MALLAVFVLVYSLIAGRVDKLPLSGPMIYVAFGLLLGPATLGVLDLDIASEGLRTLAELTLAFVLFTDAANANRGVLERTFGLPVRLLLIGLPLTILAGFGVGIALFRDLTLIEVAILATMLAPTDAALGEAVVENEDVPANIREGLNVESGLNDGICVPILFTFMALATESNAGDSAASLAARLIAQEIGIGVGVGLGLTLIAGWLMMRCSARGWISDVWIQVPVVANSVACFALAQTLGGSGFIAAFSGGLLFGALCRKHKARFLEAAEGTGETFALLTWVVFGAAVVGPNIRSLSLPVLGYAVLSLTLVRMVPVFIAVTGMGLDTGSKLFLGWFGPRGLASIVFGIIVLDANLAGGDTLGNVVVWTITLSIILHGISANPLSSAYGRKMSQSGAGQGPARQ